MLSFYSILCAIMAIIGTHIYAAGYSWRCQFNIIVNILWLIYGCFLGWDGLGVILTGICMGAINGYHILNGKDSMASKQYIVVSIKEQILVTLREPVPKDREELKKTLVKIAMDGGGDEIDFLKADHIVMPVIKEESSQVISFEKNMVS